MVTFDRSALLTANKAIPIPELEKQFGQIGLVNGPRTGKDKRSTQSNEAYLARRLIIHLPKRGKFEFPITVLHQDAPDFVVKHGTEEFCFEVTEVYPSEDGHRFSNEEDNRAHPIGASLSGDHIKPWRDLRLQLQNSLDNKCSKPYAKSGSVNLLLYPNSDASQWVALFEEGVIPPSFFGLDFSPLKAVFVLWKGEIYQLSPTKLEVQ